jgi:hypothetical protein
MSSIKDILVNKFKEMVCEHKWRKTLMVVCGIDSGSLVTPSYVAWSQDNKFPAEHVHPKKILGGEVEPSEFCLETLLNPRGNWKGST